MLFLITQQIEFIYRIRSMHLDALGAYAVQMSAYYIWWRHQMETFSALLAICAGNSPVTVEFPTRRPVTRSFDVFFDLRLNKRLSKQSWGWLFEMPSCPLWRQCNVCTYTNVYICVSIILPIKRFKTKDYTSIKGGTLVLCKNKAIFKLRYVVKHLI